MIAGNVHVLPDSRLQDQNQGAFMADWPLPSGKAVRIEIIPFFCPCGKLGGYCPRDNTTFLFWLCNQCYEKYGDIAGTYAIPEDEFNRAVQYEMQVKHGHDLTELEIFQLAEQGKLGMALELLARESPYPVPSHVV